MVATMELIGQVVSNLTKDSHGSSPTLNTQGRTSNAPRFTPEQISKTSAFFARIVTVYGRGRAKTLWGNSDEQFQIMRREWAKTIGGLSVDQLENIFDRLKEKLAAGDDNYHWPDIARMLALLNDGKRSAAHRVFRPGLPEPAWRREQRREVGRIASQTAMAVLRNRACFIEDRPEG
jgi:hypothetical protein